MKNKVILYFALVVTAFLFVFAIVEKVRPLMMFSGISFIAVLIAVVLTSGSTVPEKPDTVNIQAKEVRINKKRRKK